MFDLDDFKNENKEYHNKNGHIFQILHMMLITRSSGSGKTNALVNLMKEQENDKLIGCLW